MQALSAFVFNIGFALLIGLMIGAVLFKVFWHAKGAGIVGSKGERYVSGELHKLDPLVYTTMDNISLPSSGSTTNTQIDHVVVSSFGIFCIETKSHSGYIYGSARKERWTQVLAYTHKYKMYNPLRQNYAHIKALETLLGYKLKVPIISFVTFPYADKLIIDGTDAVVRPGRMIERILSYKQVIYSIEEKSAIIANINDANIIDPEILARHKAQVQDLHQYKI